MFLTKIDIKNFRGIVELSLSLDETTVLIGDNNTGKSTILAAIQICLNSALNKKGGAFGEYDYHLKDKDGQPTDAVPIEITLTFSESEQEEWSDEIIRMLNGVTGIGQNDLQCVILRATSRYDDATKSFTTSVDFLNPQQQALRGNPPNALRNLRRLVPTFYLAALRDAAREFRAGSQFWGPFVRALKIDPILRQQIETDLANLNKQVLNAHTAFDMVRQHLGKTAGLVPLGGGTDPVAIEAIPRKVFDLLSRTQVMLHQVAPGSLSADELRRLDHHIGRHRGHFLFSRLWLLVEGETDEFIFQEATRILDRDLFSAGVCCFKFTELTVSHFIKVADQLGIDWIVVCDSDPRGDQYADAAKASLGTRGEADFIRRVPHGDMETFLCVEGYGSIFEATIPEQERKKTPITAVKGTTDYWKCVAKLQPRRGKPERAASVMEKMETAGAAGIPNFIKETIEMAIMRATEAR